MSADEWMGREALLRLLSPPEAIDPETYQPLLDRLRREVLGRRSGFRKEKAEGRLEVQGFVRLTQEGRARRLTRNYRRLKSRSVVLELIRRSRRLSWTDLERAEGLAVYAQRLLGQIRGRDLVAKAGGKATLADLKAMLCGHLGNLARLRRRWPAAYENFGRAFAAWEQGSLDPAIEADLHSLYGSLLRDRQVFGAAFTSFETAAAIYTELGDEHRRGLVALNVASVHWEQGRPEEALAAHRAGLELLNEIKEPGHALAAWSNLAEYYLQLDRIREATSTLKLSASLARSSPAQSLARICWSWQAGRVALAQGRYRAAERRLNAAYLAFCRRPDPCNAGRVGLDLSRLYALEGRLEDLQAIMPETVRLLTSQDLHKDAGEAIEAYRRAVEQRDVVVLEIVAGAIAALRNHQRGAESLVP